MAQLTGWLNKWMKEIWVSQRASGRDRGSSCPPRPPLPLLTGRKVESIGLGMARTGGMVVITVLLSVAMFLLVVGFIIALALGARK